MFTQQLLRYLTTTVLITVALGLLTLEKTNPVLIDHLRTVTTDTLTPLLDILSRPATNVANFLERIRGLVTAQEDNIRLREENAKLLYLQTKIRQLKAENEALHSLSHIVPEDKISLITARVIALTEGPFIHSALLNVGRQEGVQKGQAVLSRNGLVGRINRVGDHSASILLLTDSSSRIPVVVIPSYNRAILIVDKGKLRLAYMIGNGSVTPGDYVVTTEEAQAFPPDLPVGMVISAENPNNIIVQPIVQSDAMEYVCIVDYDLNGILPDIPETGGTQ